MAWLLRACLPRAARALSLCVGHYLRHCLTQHLSWAVSCGYAGCCVPDLPSTRYILLIYMYIYPFTPRTDDLYDLYDLFLPRDLDLSWQMNS